MKDQSLWTFSYLGSAVQVPPYSTTYTDLYYYPTQIEDRFGNSIYLGWSVYQVATPDPSTAVVGGFPQLSIIYDKNYNILLNLDYQPDSSNPQNYYTDFVSEWPGTTGATNMRGISYTVASFANQNSSGIQSCDELTSVTIPQIAQPYDQQYFQKPPKYASGTGGFRYEYGYQDFGNKDPGNSNGPEQVPYLNTIQTPDPSGASTPSFTYNQGAGFTWSGTYAQATLTYDQTTGAIVSVQDANKNTTTLQDWSNTNNGTQNPNWSTYASVTVTNQYGGIAKQEYINVNPSSLSPTSYLVITLIGNPDKSITPYTWNYGSTSDPFMPSSVTDGNNRTWNYQWDVYGNLTKVTTPKGTATQYDYDTTNYAPGLLDEVAPAGKTPTIVNYNLSTRSVSSIQTPVPGNAPNSGNQETTSYTYTALGNVQTITTPGNNAVSTRTVTFNYTQDGSSNFTEALGEPVTVSDSLSHVWHARYDNVGNCTEQWDPNGNETDYVYYLDKQVGEVVSPATGTSGSSESNTAYAYLYLGGPLAGTATYDESGSQNYLDFNSYGHEGELTGHSWQNTSNGTIYPDVSYGYDAAYRLTTIKDGNAEPTQYIYNVGGLLTNVQYPLYGSTYDQIQFTQFDGVGNVTKRLDGNGVETDYTYGDSDGLLSKVHYPTESSLDQTFTYDTFDRLSTMNDSTGSFAIGGTGQGYDDLDNVINTYETYSGQTAVNFTYNYYPDNSRKSMATTGSLSWTYDYDAAGRLTSLISPQGTTGYGYGNNDWLSSCTLPNGYVTNYQYFPSGAYKQVSEVYGSTQLALYSFGSGSYDGDFNEKYRTESLSVGGTYNGSKTRAYDWEERIKTDESSQVGGYNYSFQWDNASNPTTFKGTTYGFNHDNQVSSLSYDGNGNTGSYYGTSCTYDLEGRLTGYGSVTMGYRADGLRAWKNTSSGQTFYYYDGDQPVLEGNSSGTITTLNVFGPAGLISRTTNLQLGTQVSQAGSPPITGPRTTYYQFDPSGNVSVRSSAASGLLSESSTTGFGTATDSASASDPFAYQAQNGYYLDRETGLYYCQHRFYDPNHGRWLNRDPIGQSGGTNVYGYCGGSPTSAQDSSGLEGGVLEPALDAAELAEDALDPAINDLGPGPGQMVRAGSRAAARAAGRAAARTAAGILGIGIPAEQMDPDLPDQIACNAMQYGQWVHQEFTEAMRQAAEDNPGTIGFVNRQLPEVANRSDAVGTAKRVVLELKPYSGSVAEAEEKARDQLDRYIGILNQAFPGTPWTGKALGYPSPFPLNR